MRKIVTSVLTMHICIALSGCAQNSPYDMKNHSLDAYIDNLHAAGLLSAADVKSIRHGKPTLGF